MPRTGLKLKKKQDFDSVYRKGRSFSGSNMYLKVLFKDKGDIRYQVVVPKKLSNKAVIRNKNRRRVDSSVKKILSEMEKTFDAIIFLTKDTKDAPFQDVDTEVRGLFKKAGLL